MEGKPRGRRMVGTSGLRRLDEVQKRFEEVGCQKIENHGDGQRKMA